MQQQRWRTAIADMLPHGSAGYRSPAGHGRRGKGIFRPRVTEKSRDDVAESLAGVTTVYKRAIVALRTRC